MRILTGLLVLLALLGGAVYWYGARSAGSPAAEGAKDSDGVAATDFSLPTAQGRSLRLSELKGKPVLLNFWATWCPPCLDELPSLLKAAERMKRELGVETIAVSEDQSFEAVTKFLAEKKLWPTAQLPLTILLDTDSKTATSYGSTKYPETYFIDRNLRIQRKFVGPQDWTSQEIMAWLTEHSK